ncbi:hypothetical protein PAMA_010685 [Pampus argenteus]
MKEFCSEHRQTVCSPCEEGFFSDEYDIFDRCEECQSCQQEYVEECTLTTNANCSCRSGFLCSNKMCSKCEENKCITGEKPMRSDNNPIDIVEVSANSYDCHMSKEESGLQLIIQDKSKDNNTCSLQL